MHATASAKTFTETDRGNAAGIEQGADTVPLLKLLQGGRISPMTALREAAGIDGERFEKAYGLLSSYPLIAGGDAEHEETPEQEPGSGLVASALTEDEKEILAVVHQAGGVPKGHGSRVFGYRRNRSFRPAANTLVAMGLLDAGTEGMEVTARGRSVLASLGEEAVNEALAPYFALAHRLSETAAVNPELRERMLTAVMGSLRIAPAFGDRNPAAIDSAVLHVLAARGSMMTVELIDMVGVPGLEVRASVERIDACGVANFGQRYRSAVTVRPEADLFTIGSVDPEMAEALLFASHAAEFHIDELVSAREALGRGGDVRSSMALVKLMTARGHLTKNTAYMITDTGAGMAGWIEDELVSGACGEEAAGLPGRVAEAMANPSAAGRSNRGGEGRLVRSLPGKASELRTRLEGMEPDEADRVAGDWPFPPDRHDRRLFGAAADHAEGPEPREGIEETVHSLIWELGPASVAEIAASTGDSPKAVAEALADLAAARLVLDTSDDAARRSTEWREFCMMALAVIEADRLYPVSVVRDLVPGSAFADVKAALRYLERRGELSLSMRCSQKMYALPSLSAARPLPKSGRGQNWARIVEIASSGPTLQSALAGELGVSGERVRQMAEVLVSEGRLRSFRLEGKGGARCLVRPDMTDAEIDAALAETGLPRRRPVPELADVEDSRGGLSKPPTNP